MVFVKRTEDRWHLLPTCKFVCTNSVLVCQILHNILCLNSIIDTCYVGREIEYGVDVIHDIYQMFKGTHTVSKN